MAIQIGKYKRPGIFIEEFDNSIITTPIVEGITNMIIGVSKKGPVNTPIRLTTVNDLESVFGTLDRGLERKGSFFHRTISKMLESSPIFAINLLSTDDTLDVIEYKSLSSSSGYTNDIEREGPYRRFFDTTGFWKRDTESFINLTKTNTGYAERAFSLTNLSDKYVTAFVFKSQVAGFDRTLVDSYGSIDRMPPYLNANDFASDYLVDVVIVSGDWSDYQNLAIDNRWSAYFSASGIVKGQIRNFANDRNVTLLAYYEGLSLIPYFRNANGTNIFIETTINRDTDKTGLFCAFNSDLVETDYYNGRLDLVGQTIAGVNEAEIEFLSYKEKIAESIEITAVPLDLPGNVTALLGGGYGYSTLSGTDHAFGSPVSSGIATNANNRTPFFAEGYVYNVTLGATSSASASISVTYNVAAGAFATIGGVQVPVSATTSLVIDATDYPNTGVTTSYVSTFILDSTGDILLVSNLTGVTTGSPTNPSVAASDLVLGYVELKMISGSIAQNLTSFNNVNIDGSGFVDFTFGNSSSYDYFIGTHSTPDSGVIKIEFKNTNAKPSTNNYAQYRRFKQFNRLVDLIDSPNKNKMTLLLENHGATGEKASLSTMTISDIVTSSTSNKSFILNTGLTDAKLADILAGTFVLYTVDNEFFLGASASQTKNTVATATEGIIARYSKFYSRFYDGIINTGDYFYGNYISTPPDTYTVVFIDGEVAAGTTSSYSGYNYVLFDGTDLDLLFGDKFIIPGSTLNTGSFTNISGTNDALSATARATALGYSGYRAYEVNEEVAYEELLDVSLIYNYNLPHYLKMYLDNDGLLNATFWDDEIFSGNTGVDIEADNTFFIQSAKSNFKQSIEIELPTGYVQVPNKILIKASRYTEVKVGDFLSAYYDSSLLAVGEVPRKLTRILSKKQYAGDTTLTEITCDSRIETVNFSGDLQTTRYSSIDNYATTYKAISLKGWRVRQASLPDGTETRQNSILNLVAKGTPLFKAITNKEAIDFRYLIDSFGLGLTERSKQQLVDICGERLDALGILNMPSMKSFKNSSSPSFINTEGVLQLEYVSKGADPESSPAFLYSFGDGSGTTAVGYFMPYVTVNDNGRPVDVPPSAYVASTYMRKQTSNVSGTTPWTIAAGVTNGRITNITATEMDFTLTDIEYINTAQ